MYSKALRAGKCKAKMTAFRENDAELDLYTVPQKRQEPGKRRNRTDAAPRAQRVDV